MDERMSATAPLKAWRKARGWTQADLGAFLGVTGRTVNRSERANCAPRMALLALGLAAVERTGPLPHVLGSDYG